MTEENKNTNVATKEEAKDTKSKDVDVKTNVDSKKENLKQLSIDKRSKVKSVSDKEQNIRLTETDGTVIDVNIKAPGMRDLEDIDAQRNLLVADSKGVNAIRLTPADFHEALFGLFGTPLVNDEAKGPINWDFFDQHERETYNFMMETADTFLTSLS